MMGRLNRQPKKDRTESIGQVLFEEILPENFQELVKKIRNLIFRKQCPKHKEIKFVPNIIIRIQKKTTQKTYKNK
jgi:hypothetical protein